MSSAGAVITSGPPLPSVSAMSIRKPRPLNASVAGEDIAEFADVISVWIAAGSKTSG